MMAILVSVCARIFIVNRVGVQTFVDHLSL